MQAGEQYRERGKRARVFAVVELPKLATHWRVILRFDGGSKRRGENRTVGMYEATLRKRFEPVSS